MPTLLQTTQGTVTALWGSATVKGADGRTRPLKMGDIVRRGDVILTTQDGIVQLTSDPSAAATATTTADPAAAVTAPAKSTAATATPGDDVDQVIEKLAQNDADAATAAGLAAGDGGEFLPGLRVGRISELLTPLSGGDNEATAQDLGPVFANEGSSADTLANIAPSALDASVSGPENTTLPVALRGVDSDGNVVSVTVTAIPTGGTLLLADGSTVVGAGQTLTPAQAAGLLFRPAADFVGQALITFFVTDNQGSSSNGATVSLNLGDSNPPPPNQAPVAVNDSATVVEDAPANGNVLGNDSDPDGNPLTVTQFVIEGVSYAAGATAVVTGVGSLTLAANGAYTFTPVANYNGPVPVATYTVSDGVASVSATLTLSVSPVADGAVISAGTGSVTEDAVVIGGNITTGGTLTVTDADAGQAMFQAQAATAGTHGTFTLSTDGAWTYTASNSNPMIQALGAGQSLSEPFTVRSADGTTSTVTVTVNGANEPPVAVVTPASGIEDATDISVTLGGTDVDGSIASFTIGSLPTNGVLLFGGTPVTLGQTISATAGSATLSFVPAANFNGSTSFDFTATDNEGAVSPSVNAPITVSTVNDAPVAVNDSFTTLEDIPVTIAVRSNDGDADGDPLAVTQVNGSPITVGGAGIVVTGGVVTLNGAGHLVFTPTLNYNGTPSFTYTVADPTGATSTATVSGTVTPQNDMPVARSDDGNVTASQTLIVSAAEGVIQSTAVAAGRDTDIDGDALSVTRVSAGTGAPTTSVPSGGVTVTGTYGDLLLRNDGSYTYVASRADAVPTGTQVSDVFAYQVSDGNGGFATAALTLHVGGSADTLNAAPPTTAALTAPLGLNGEYYGYNDFNPGPTSPNRRHSDDGLHGNLDRADDVARIVDGRNAAFVPAGTPGIAGTAQAAAADTADARFLARTIDYGSSPAVTGTLGTNPNTAAGGSTAGLTNGNSQLYKFLGGNHDSDASTLSIRAGTADNDTLGGGPTSGLGRTTDAAIRISGQAYLAAGLYDIRVHAGDSFRLLLDDQRVAYFDGTQSPTTRVYSGIPLEGGLTPLELLYAESGSNAALRIEFKLSGTADSAYQTLGSQNLPLFTDANANTLALTDLQDIVAGPTPGSYLVRTGSLLDGGNGDDTLSGNAGRDILIGGQGRDALNGGAGDDLIRGGSGDDLLSGGAGHDVFRWSLGDASSAGAPARDVISDFDNTPHGGDVLDLRDLLVGESHLDNALMLPGTIGLNNVATMTPNEGNLANYLHFSTVGGDTVVEISSTGGFAGSYTPAAVDQVITLAGLNLVGSFSNDHQVINDLLQRGKLVTD